LNFSTILRATLRQDPDVLLIGEIRDAESAEIALRAAMTGHMVLSTLHTNDAVTSALRLVDMGVDTYLVASSLKAVVAQRLVRKICVSCSEPYTPNEQELIMADALRDNDVLAFNTAAHAHPNYRPLSQGALNYALQGVTTMDEVMRVTAEIEEDGLETVESPVNLGE